MDSGKGKNPEYSRLNEQLSILGNEQNFDARLLGLQTRSAILTNVEEDATGAIANDGV